MLVVGLTGGIASGKSTVSQYLRELGAKIIDADVIARELVYPQSSAWQEIVNHFGREIIDESGFIKRKELGQIIFQSPAEREVLNEILHPKIKQRIAEQIQVCRQKKDLPLIVVDAPLLIETGISGMVDEVWVVAIPLELQLQRLRERDNLSVIDAQKRLASQMPLQEKTMYAKRVIDNSGTINDMKIMVNSLWKQVVSMV